jgi:hypothetical protein
MYNELDMRLAALDGIAAFDNGLLPLPTALDAQTNLISAFRVFGEGGSMQLMEFAEPIPVPDKSARPGARYWWDRIALLAAGLAIIGLFSRIMTYPLQHDEQFYLPAAILFSFGTLYDGLGFSHLPNFPLLLSGIFALLETDHYVLVGRLTVFAAWLATGAALVLIGRLYARSGLVSALMVALLVANPALLDAAGMTATNNFIAVPFALFGLVAFIEATKGSVPSPGLAALAGWLLALAVGFKANYAILLPPVAIAAFLVPRHASLSTRLVRVVLPVFVGGLIGGAPTLYFLAVDPAGFVAHIFSFHRGPQIAYWRAHADPADPKIMSMSAKAILAQREWTSGANLILFLVLACYATLSLGAKGNMRRFRPGFPWPILLLTGTLCLAAVASFLPTPAFPQYFTTPLPFAIMLIALLHGSLDAHARAVARPFLIAALGMTVLIGAPMLLASVPKLFFVARWTGFRVHEDAQQVAAIVRGAQPNGTLATLSPVHALEGGLAIDPALAMGPFVYRASEWIPPRDRRHYLHLASPASIGQLLDRAPPAGILIGFEGPLDAPLAAYAARHDYVGHRLSLGQMEGAKEPWLFTAPVRRLPYAPAVGRDVAVLLPARLPSPEHR